MGACQHRHLWAPIRVGSGSSTTPRARQCHSGSLEGLQPKREAAYQVQLRLILASVTGDSRPDTTGIPRTPIESQWSEAAGVQRSLPHAS